MHDPKLVQVLNRTLDLLEKLASLRLRQLLLVHDVLEQLAAADVLHDQKELLRRLYNFKQLDDVGVPDHLQNFDFAAHSLHVGLFDDLSLFKDLNGDLQKLDKDGWMIPFLLSKCEYQA